MNHPKKCGAEAQSRSNLLFYFRAEPQAAVIFYSIFAQIHRSRHMILQMRRETQSRSNLLFYFRAEPQSRSDLLFYFRADLQIPPYDFTNAAGDAVTQ